MTLPKVWREGFDDYISLSLKNEAAKQFRIHQLPDNLPEWKKKSKELRNKIWHSMGVNYDDSIALNCQETGSVDMDGYSIKKVYFQSRKDMYVTGNLYVPFGKGPFPGVLVVHGHWSQGRLAEKIQEKGHTLAKNGYVCLAVDAFGSGERSNVHGEYEYHGLCLGGSLMNIGETLMGVQVVDNMRGIDLLCSLDNVDSSKIGVTGGSGGGNQTMWVAAMDDRVTAAMPVVSVGSFESYVTASNCVCELLPDGLTYTEESGVLALIAPRALKICNCLGDTNPAFAPSEMLRSFDETKKIFRQYGAYDKLAYQVFNLPHGYWPEIREAMLGWFDLHLKGSGNGTPKQEIPFKCLPEEDLMVFEKGKRDKCVISIAEYCRQKGAELKGKYLSSSSINPKSARTKLSLILQIGKQLKLKEAHRYSFSGDWERIALETECGRMLPLLLRKSSCGKNDYLLFGAAEGKGELEKTKLFKEADASGKGMLIFDLWGTGETFNCETSIYTVVTRSLLWLGRTLLGEWVKDYQLVESFLKDLIPEAHATFFGYKEAGIAALFCSALKDAPSPVILEKSPVSFVYNEKVPEHEVMALLLPSILKWGDVPLAISLTQGNVRFIDPAFFDGLTLSEIEKQKIISEFDVINQKNGQKASLLFE